MIPTGHLIFFHELGLSHMELELMTSAGTPQGGNWVLEEGMVAPVHLLYPGGLFDRSWCEEVIEVRADGGKPMTSSRMDRLSAYWAGRGVCTSSKP